MYLYCFDARFSICLIACRCIIYSNPIIIILTLFIYYISILHCNAIIYPFAYPSKTLICCFQIV